MAKRRKKRKIARRAPQKFSLFSRLFRRRKEKQAILPDEIRPWVFGIFLIVAAIFTILSFFNLTALAGKGFLKVFGFFMGEAIFIVPLIFVLGGLSCFFSREKARWSIFIAVILLAVGTSGILGLFDLSHSPEAGFRFFYAGRGGWLGNISAWPLMKVFGFWLTLIILLSLIIIAGLIFWFFIYSSRRKEEASKEEEEEEFRPEEMKELRKPLIRRVFAPKFQVSKVEDKKEVKKKEEKEAEETEEPGAAPVIGTAVPSAMSAESAITDWKFPSLDLLAQDRGTPQAGDVKTNAEIIEKTLEHFGISVQMSDINIGPTVTQYTLKPAEGVKLSKITTLNNNLALALAAHPLRIEAPIPGKSLVGIEVPNKSRTLVRLRNLVDNPVFQSDPSTLIFTVGRDVVGEAFYANLGKMPHLLVAGSTGSGKTICLSAIILSLLYKNSPEQMRLILIDPKRVEFSNYNGLPHLLSPVIFDVQKTLSVLKWLIDEMERRFEILSDAGNRNIDEYNRKIKNNGNKQEEAKIMPYIVLIIDELADLMAAKGREIEAGVVRLAQKARAVGIHLILATQRPSVEVITGLIKANIIARIAFQVASQVDSRTILDASGAEKLLGLGDLLFISAEYSKPKRLQGAYVSSKEVEQVVDFIKKQNHKKDREDELADSINSELQRLESFGTVAKGGEAEFDPVYLEAKQLVLETKKASASFLQRKLRIGYARAARLLDMLEERGIVGPADGAKPREVFIDEEAILRRPQSQTTQENEDEFEPEGGDEYTPDEEHEDI
ncbi:DNA translocase FtsK [Patescibacteria group bacterium]|nr:DNA translocase FtsK [Patescibacteria group bacterium]